MEKEHSDLTEFENEISTKGIGPVTKYSRSGKVRNIHGGCCFFFHPGYIFTCPYSPPLPILQPSSRMIMIDKASKTFYWAEVGNGILQRRKSSGFFRNIQEPLQLYEMVIICEIHTELTSRPFIFSMI